MSPEDKKKLALSINNIIMAGFADYENPYFILCDANDQPVDLEARKMSANDVFAFAEKYYGREARQICQRFSQLSAH